MVMDNTGITVMLKAFVAVRAGVLESAAWTVKLAVPAVVGVPLKVPLAAKTTPAGSAPAITDQVIGGAPPVASKLAL